MNQVQVHFHVFLPSLSDPCKGRSLRLIFTQLIFPALAYPVWPSLSLTVLANVCRRSDYTEQGHIGTICVTVCELSVNCPVSSTAVDGWAQCVNVLSDVRTTNDALVTDAVVNALRRLLYVACLAKFVLFSIC